MAKRGPNFNKFVKNCEPVRDLGTDWGFEDAQDARYVYDYVRPPWSKDLRKPWWKIRDQGRTGACVGYATADGVLRYLYWRNGLMTTDERPSPRFIWMANKETDDLTRYPTTFLESAGTSTKLALSVAQKFGCVPESMLPMDGALSPLRASVFFSIAAHFRITAYYNLGTNLDRWRRWIASTGPILTRLNLDHTWRYATTTKGVLSKYADQKPLYGGHAVCLVGYTSSHFIVRNSWGTNWGDKGFAYASNAYAERAFTDTYGAVL